VAAFLDTNVVVYAHDHGAPHKRRRAIELLRSGDDDFVISTQVLSEFYWVVTRKLAPPLDGSEALLATRLLASLPVVTVDRDLVLSAVDTVHDHRLGLWDALIIEAAARGGCDRLLTEDLGHGDVIRGVRVVNPFLEDHGV
jgi:predicted nucleic acid-binding protein